MPIIDNKLDSFSFNHKDQIDDLYTVMTSEEVKNNFDSRAEELQEALNGLIDRLRSLEIGDSGAQNVGLQPIEGVPGANVYDALRSLKSFMDGLALGYIPDNSLTNAKLRPEIKIGNLPDLATVIKTSLTNAINELVARLNSNDTAITARVPLTDITTTAEINKIPRLNEFGKFAGSITGNSDTVDNKHATVTLNTTEKTDLAGAINEVNTKADTKITKAGDTNVGKLVLLASGAYSSGNEPGIDVNNTDLIGLNALYWNDETDASAEGLFFPKPGAPSDSRVIADYNTLKVSNNKILYNGVDMMNFAPAGFGLGGLAVDKSAVDMNTITSTGFYMGWGMPNQPADAGLWIYFITIANSASWIVQIAYNFDAGAMWTRIRTDTGWKAWRKAFFLGDAGLGKTPAFTWTGTIASGSSATITHNLGYTPIVIAQGNGGNYILNWQLVNANQIWFNNYNSANSTWNGSVYFY